MSEKVVGYAMLFFGIGMILFAGFNVFQIFRKQIKPVALFDFPAIVIDSKQAGLSVEEIDTSDLSEEEAALIDELKKQEASKPAKMELVPGEILNESANLFGHIILMGFVASIGYKIAGLGVMMLRPIVVKVKEQKQPLEGKWEIRDNGQWPEKRRG